MGEISKLRQLKKNKRYGVEQDLSVYDMRLILKFLFKHCLMNEIEILKIGLNRLDDT